jgi:hypothetical protein
MPERLRLAVAVRDDNDRDLDLFLELIREAILLRDYDKHLAPFADAVIDRVAWYAGGGST